MSGMTGWVTERLRHASEWFVDTSTHLEGELNKRPRRAGIVQLIRDVVKTQADTRASLASAGAAFWLVIALFPALTAAISIFGLVVDQAEVNEAFSDLGNGREGSIGAAISKQIAVLTSTPSASLSIGLIISLLFSLWSVSNGSYNLMRAIRLSYGQQPQGYIVARFRGMVAGTVAVVMLGFIAFGSSAANSINGNLGGFQQFMFTFVVSFPIKMFVITASVCFLFRYSIATRTGIRRLLPGSLLATLALVLMATVINWFFSTLGGDSAVYGVAAGAVSGLIGVYFAIYVIVLGAIVNANWPTVLTQGPFWGIFHPKPLIAESNDRSDGVIT